VQANDSIVFDNGHNVYPIKTDKIRMVSEKITIVMDRTVLGVAAAQADVTCDFLFENTSNQEVIAEVGFPTIEVGMYYSQDVSLYGFRSFVEGKEVPVNIKKETLKDAEPLTDDSDMPHRYWYTWKVKFPPKARLKIRNTYETQLSEDSVKGRWFKYILVTGANWKGKIDRSIIEVIYPDAEQLKNRVVNASPEGFTIKENRIIWDLRNFTPAKDIFIGEVWVDFRSSYRNVINDYIRVKKYDGNIREYAFDDMKYQYTPTGENSIDYIFGNIYTAEVYSKDVAKLKARVLRNEIYARHGRKFKSKDLQKIFGSTKWYKPNPKYSDDMLNDMEKKNVKLVLDYEKKMGWR
jgi:hypothetical protein